MVIERKAKAGFTLVELSIVLVILGLLVGGVLSGQSLIHASQLRAVTTEVTNYKTALNAFRDKYFGLPGDITNATSYWGAASDVTTCFTTASTTAATCNGDGDGMIDSYGNTSGVGDEYRRAWQQLTNAGLVEGSFNGIGAPGGDMGNLPGINVPRSKFPGAAWAMIYDGPGTLPGSDPGGNQLRIGSSGDEGDADNVEPIFKPEDAYNIDAKIDDGYPDQGAVRTPNFNPSFNCMTASPNATYAYSTTAPTCALAFYSGY